MFRRAISVTSGALRASLVPSYKQRSSVTSPLSVASLSARTPLALNSRWYSDQAQVKKDGEGDTNPVTQSVESEELNAPEPTAEHVEQQGAQQETQLREQLETAQREAIDWRDRYIRSVAEFRNLQDRAQRDQKAARDFAIQSFAKDLVDSVDNLDRALSMGQQKLAVNEGQEKNPDLTTFYDGVKMTEDIMMSTLKKHGLERFSPEGEKFNPNEHEATFMTPQPNNEDGTVFMVQQKGFKLNGRILRAAKVGVVKNAQDGDA